MRIYVQDFRDVLPGFAPGDYDMIFGDPPDNIGLGYDSYCDRVSDFEYYQMIKVFLLESMRIGKVVWLSYYWQHDIEIKSLAREILRNWRPSWRAKTFIWRYTFGQCNSHDCGSGFRFLLRLSSLAWKPSVEGIRVQSTRQAIGDIRANPNGRVPDDVWDFDCEGIWTEFPRVVGNSSERRAWHPTQHPEGLMERIVRLSGGDRVFDAFLGTGTTMRVCKRLGVECDGCEMDNGYAVRSADELGAEIHRLPECDL